MEKFTVESLFDGRIRLRQPQTGYRYTIDPIILSSHLSPAPGTRILDIGCGCGIMPLILGFRHPDTSITGVEIQKDLADLAARNIVENKMQDTVSIIHADILENEIPEDLPPFDLIISNPPYKKANSGRLNPDVQKATARHEIKLSIGQLFAKADSLLKSKGRIVVIFPSERLFDLYQAMFDTSFSPEWLRFIHPLEEKNAKRVIVSAVRNIKSSCEVRPPLYLHDNKNNPTKAYKGLFNP